MKFFLDYEKHFILFKQLDLSTSIRQITIFIYTSPFSQSNNVG